MLQSSLFSQPGQPVPSGSTDASVEKASLNLTASTSDPAPRKRSKRKGKATPAVQQTSTDSPHSVGQEKILADSQTSILARFAPDAVVPIPDLLSVYQGVDRRLANLLNTSTTVEAVGAAFAAEPYGCYGEALRQLEPAAQTRVRTLLNERLRQLLELFHSLDPDQVANKMAMLPPVLRCLLQKLMSQTSQPSQRNGGQS